MHFDVSATLYLYYESNTARILIYNNDIVTILQSGPLFLIDLRIMSCSITWTYTRHIPIQQFHTMKFPWNCPSHQGPGSQSSSIHNVSFPSKAYG